MKSTAFFGCGSLPCRARTTPTVRQTVPTLEPAHRTVGEIDAISTTKWAGQALTFASLITNKQVCRYREYHRDNKPGDCLGTVREFHVGPSTAAAFTSLLTRSTPSPRSQHTVHPMALSVTGLITPCRTWRPTPKPSRQAWAVFRIPTSLRKRPTWPSSRSAAGSHLDAGSGQRFEADHPIASPVVARRKQHGPGYRAPF